MLNSILKSGIHPDKIVLQGNCLGAAVAMDVQRHFSKRCGLEMRIINSNSFKSLNSYAAHNFKVPFLQKPIKKLLSFVGWKRDPVLAFRTVNLTRLQGEGNAKEDKIYIGI